MSFQIVRLTRVPRTLATVLAIAFALTLGLAPRQASAYEEDTHFLMTFAMLRAVGFTDTEARIVASVDQGMDDSGGSSGTVANDVEIPYVDQEWKWHALDLNGNMGASGVVQRKSLLFRNALKETDYYRKLQLLGMYYHFQQDTWAHRHHYAEMFTLLDGYSPNFANNYLSYDNYETFDTPLGHALWLHQPDRPPFAPAAALNSLQEGVVSATLFLTSIGRTPNPLFAGYTPANGSDDDNWSDDRKGAAFHQLALDAAPGTARFVLESLIRAQVNAYHSSFDLLYKRDTADALTVSALEPPLQSELASLASTLGCTIDLGAGNKEMIQFTDASATAREDAAAQMQPLGTVGADGVRMIVVTAANGKPAGSLAVDPASPGSWNEYDPCGLKRHSFTTTTARFFPSKPNSENSLYLFDAGRGETLQVDLAARVVNVKHRAGDIRRLERIQGTYPRAF